MIQAVIFDLDGTVLDNEGVWEEVFRAVARKSQIPIHKSQEWIHEPGIGISPNWEKIIGKGERADKLSKETWKEYWKRIGNATNIPVRDGLVELVAAIKEKGWQTALATGSDWNVVADELEQLDLYLAFDVTTTGEEVLAFKPDPQIYLLTSQKLGVDPQECAVVEDSLAGVQAAAEAGMTVVGLTGPYASHQELRKAGAKLQVDNLSEVMLGLGDHGS